MDLLFKNKLIKLKVKNRGNRRLTKAIDSLISDIESSNWCKKADVKDARPDADCVHNDGFYFFDLHIHRTMILIVFEENEASVIWVGSHDEYEQLFKNNKVSIEKWLRAKGLI